MSQDLKTEYVLTLAVEHALDIMRSAGIDVHQENGDIVTFPHPVGHEQMLAYSVAHTLISNSGMSFPTLIGNGKSKMAWGWLPTVENPFPHPE